MYEVINGIRQYPQSFADNVIIGKMNIRHKVFFVSERAGIGASDDNEGTDPSLPLATISQAVTNCTTKRGDYIFVLDFWTEASPPLTINKKDIHLIGMGSGNFDAGNDITTPTNNKSAVYITSDGYDMEFAGFNLSSSGTNGVALQLQEGYRLHLHHLTFGCNIACTTGISGNSFTHSTLHDCLFGTLVAGNSFYTFLNTSIVRNNRFLATSGTCISCPGGSGFLNTIVEGNKFLVDDAAHGDAINLAVAGASGNMIDDNVVMNGNALSDYSYNPYRDIGTTKSHWGRNWRGNEIIEPITV